MQSRLLKQFIYGVLYLWILFGLGYGLYALVIRQPSCTDLRQNQGESGIDCGGPCPSCELRQLKPIEVRSARAFDAGEGRGIVLIELRNENVRYGAEQFSYQATIYGDDAKIVGTVVKNSFIYPGEIKFIVEPATLSGKPVRVEVQLGGDVSWRPIEEFSRPDVTTRDLTTEVREETHDAVVSGVVSNGDVISLSRVVVNAVILGADGTAVAASKTLLETVMPHEERLFKIIVPRITLASIPRESLLVSVEAER